MEDNNAEMSLDEVLSSIKKMVVDEEPPVLELTDMISNDGSIVKIQKNAKDCKNKDMGSFLKLIQENQDSTQHNTKKEDNTLEDIENLNKSRQNQKNTQFLSEKHDVIYELIKEILPPILQKWINDNLPKIVSNIVETEVKNFLYRRNMKNENTEVVSS
jgi:cell pole-organizing protein PopZ